MCVSMLHGMHEDNLLAAFMKHEYFNAMSRAGVDCMSPAKELAACRKQGLAACRERGLTVSHLAS